MLRPQRPSGSSIAVKQTNWLLLELAFGFQPLVLWRGMCQALISFFFGEAEGAAACVSAGLTGVGSSVSTADCDLGGFGLTIVEQDVCCGKWDQPARVPLSRQANDLSSCGARQPQK
ncbi:hypothetical protein NDU88_008932 [Pleurodeles waltl]|uniref:Uncharacterized protein n=1 Tax=Pleurodeles waltl TaxID=8319 RepID=A0AAV7PQL8_PLEWA|nr:hypothetical protein NDU88_008932 [Pleurodeles waltl]